MFFLARLAIMLYMDKPLTVFFLTMSLLFVGAHIAAMHFSFYWYFWWADIVMHSWGGVLVGLGMHVLASLSSVPVRATLLWVVAALLVATLSWEVFERSFGLFNPDGYLLDTSIDIFLGFTGGLLAHFWLARR